MSKKLLRLDRVLSHMKIASRSELKKMARQGRIEVNGEVARNTALKVDPFQDIIEFDGIRIDYQEHFYWMMNKPPGVISATVDKRDETVLDLLDYEDVLFEPFPVGRLDKDTEGLLLLTTDGELSHFLLSPRFAIPKVYEFEARGFLNEDSVLACAQGLTLEDETKVLPAKLEIEEFDETEEITSGYLTLTEGKFHQVKRMIAVLGAEVIFLKRISFGPLDLDEELELGDYRELSPQEVEELYKAVKQN